MLLPYATGFFLGSGLTPALSYLYFKYKIFEPYKMTTTELINLSEGNKEEQSKIIGKQEVLIEEMMRYIDNKESFKDGLGMNWGYFYKQKLISAEKLNKLPLD